MLFEDLATFSTAARVRSIPSISKSRLSTVNCRTAVLPLGLRDGHEIRYRNSRLVNRMIGLCLRNRNTFESSLPNFPRDDRLEPRAIDNNKAPLPPTNDSARGEFD